jgi:hypothetical protein
MAHAAGNPRQLVRSDLAVRFACLRHQAPRSGQRVGKARLEKQPLDAGGIAREQRLNRRQTADRDEVALVRAVTGG